LIVRAWRIYKARHASTALTGEGARLYGGRWNSRGISVLYAAGSLSLACLEILVHERRLRNYRYRVLEFDERLLLHVSISSLPTRWASPRSPADNRRIGDEWIAAATSVVLRVPSAPVPGEYNYLMNPEHPDFGEIRIGDEQTLKLDPRLLRR
jgi:RES domain-containing protein